MEPPETASQDLTSLRARIASHRANGGKHYSSALKKAVLRQVDLGVSVESLSRELDLTSSLIYRWKRKPGRGRPLKTEVPEAPRVLSIEAKPTKTVPLPEAVLRFEISGFNVAISRL